MRTRGFSGRVFMWLRYGRPLAFILISATLVSCKSGVVKMIDQSDPGKPVVNYSRVAFHNYQLTPDQGAPGRRLIEN
jgi:hypothetical protein